MQRATKFILCILGLVLCVGLLLKGSITQVPSGTWAPSGTMSEARSGGSAVLLQDGRVLVTGGEGSSGTLVSAELFDSGGSFSSAAPMFVPRSRHVAIVLQDGRVLVAGGSTNGGGATNAAEIYDPTSNSWTNLAGMTEARSGHTASLLRDGRVLLAGGESSGAASATLEVFDPVAGTFAFAGSLSSPRKEHAAAVLSDGRVLILGGSNGSVSIASADVYDPATGSTTPGPNLSTPRAGLSATTLLDGQVLVAGGNDGSADLASAELYDPTAGTFSLITSSLGTPRRDHLAFLLPNNNSVLIVGGTLAGAEVPSAELYIPWVDTFTPTASPLATRSALSGTPSNLDGILLIAGGENASGKLASSELYGFATVKTDKDDYAPGVTVTITGGGWQPGEVVTMVLQEIPDNCPDRILTATADASGRIINTQFSPEHHDIGARFFLTASGSNSQAQTTFMDSPKVGSVVIGTQSPNPVTGGDSATYQITVNRGSGSGSSGTFDAALTLTTALPTGASVSFSAGSLANCTSGGQKTCFDAAANTIRFASGDNALTAVLTISTTTSTPAGNTSFTVKAATSASDFATGNGTLAVTAAPVSITIATSPSGRQIIVDGTAYTAPQTFSFIPGSTHTLDTPSPQSGGAGTQFVWTSWSQGGAKSQTLTIPSSATTYTANFKTQFQLTFAQSGIGGDSTGTILTVNGSPKTSLPFVDFFDSGSLVTYTYSDSVASTVSGKRFTLTTPAPSPGSGFTVSSALTITGNYKTQFQLTFTQSGIAGDSTGTIVTVNGSPKTTLPFSDFFDSGSTLTYSYTDPVASSVSGKRYALTTPPPSPASGFAVSSAQTVTGTYKIQYQLTFAQSGIGADSTGTVVTIAGNAKTKTDLPFGDWFDTGSSVTYSYTSPVASTDPNKRYALTSPAATPSSPVIVSTPVTITGTYKTQYQLTFAQNGIGGDSTGTIVTVNSSPKTTLPFSNFFDSGSTVTYTYADPVYSSVTGKRYALTTPPPSPASGFTVSGAQTITAMYKVQYQITFAQSGLTGDSTGTVVTVNGNNKTAADLNFIDWFDSGSAVTYTYSSTVSSTDPKKRYILATPLPAPPSPISVSGAINITGVYKVQYQLTFDQSGISSDSNGNTIVTINGNPKAATNLPFSDWFDGGSAVTYAFASPVNTADPAKRYVLTTPVPAPTSPVTVAAGVTITGTYKIQFQLTFTQIGISGDSTGTVVTIAGNPKAASTLPFSDFFDNGSSVVFAYSDPVASSIEGKRYALVSASATSPHAVTAAATITGTYKVQFELSLSITAGVPGGLANVTGGSHGTFYDINTVLSLSAATPVADGAGKQWRFNGWGGDATGGTSPVSVTMSQPRSVSANYVAQYELTLAVTAGVPNGLGNISNGTTNTFYDDGTVLGLLANTPVAELPNSKRWRFDDWSGGAVGTTNPASVTMNQPRSVTANYVAQFLITFAQNGISGDSTGTVVTVAGNPQSALPFNDWFDSGSTLTYAYADPVASSVAGKRYALTTPATSPASGFTVSSSLTITGTYKVQFQLTLAVTNGVPSGLNNIGGGTNGTFYDINTVLNLSATTPVADGASKRWRFDSWSGDTSGNSSPVSVTMNAAKSVTANYVAQYQLTLSVTPGVPSSLANVSGGNNGTFYDNGTVLTLGSNSIVPDGTGKRWRFDNWSGDVAAPPNTSNPLSLNMNQPRSVTANYIAQFLITFAQNGINGDSTGTVVTILGDPKPATNLPSSDWFDSGSNLPFGYADLVASSVNGKRYALVSVDVASPHVVAGAVTITGTYKIQFQLTLSITSGVPTGLSNIGGGTNGNFYDINTVLSLSTNTPVIEVPYLKQWRFNNWSGDATGTATPALVTMNSAKSVTANYVIPVVTSLIFDSASINENDTVTLSGSFTDPGMTSGQTVTINWGDGSPNTVLTMGTGASGFSAPHRYLDDNPTGSSSDPYSVGVIVQDTAGGIGSGLTSITVNNVAPIITNLNGPPVAIGSPASATATFTDVGGQDTHPCTFSWGDGTSDTTISASGTGNGSCAASHTYAAVGVYVASVTVKDDDLGTVSSSFLMAVYDPSAGFVTGGGWINSPAGAYPASPTLTGKANFGFVSKYKKGQSTPTGETEFQFQMANFNFHSEVYDWLVVSGAKAQYKGTGTVNGSGNYGFLLTATDGQLNGGGGTDKFRIKVWDKATGATVYDNVLGAADDLSNANPQAISNGSIVIHGN